MILIITVADLYPPSFRKREAPADVPGNGCGSGAKT